MISSQLFLQGKGLKKLLILIICISSLFGCTSIGTHILANPKVYLSDSRSENVDLERAIAEKRQFCQTDVTECIDYIYAEAYKPSNFREVENVRYTIDATSNGVTNNFTYSATPEQFQRMSGTVILFHGFGAAKEVMLTTAVYFRALGMDVISLDLFGHGESKRDFVFGAKEHATVNKLINEIETGADNKLAKPIIVVGHSMGALPATNVLLESGYVDGAILLAPMTRFDRAAKFYIADKNPIVDKLFSSSLDDIISTSMNQAGVSLNDTDVVQKIKNTTKPTLIINSDVDSISPVGSFLQAKNQFVQFAVAEGRSHPSLLAFDNVDAALVELWLSINFDSL